MTETRPPNLNESNDLLFRPLHKGVGFHPFADGLPYAPVVPPKNQGTGATAAGPARPVWNPQPMKSIRPTTPTVSSPTPVIAPNISVAPTPIAPELEMPISSEKFGWTYPFVRMIAFGLDVIFSLSLTSIAVTVILAFFDLEPWFLLEKELIGMTLLFLVCFSWAIVAIQEVAFHTTLGKRLLGLKLHGTTTAIFLRSFFFIPSFGFAGVGILWALFNTQKRCWHDAAVDLQPTRRTVL